MKDITIKDWFTSVRKLGYTMGRVVKDTFHGHKRVFTLMFVITLFSASVGYVMYWLYGHIVGCLTNPHNREMGIWFAAAALGLGFVSQLVDVWENKSERMIRLKLQTYFVLLYCKRKAAVGIDQLENPTFRDTISKAQDNLVRPILDIGLGVFRHLSNLIRLTIAVVIVGAYDWRLCVLVLIALFPQFYVDIHHGSEVWGIYDAETETRRRFNELRRHFMNRSNLIELKLFQNVEYFLSKMKVLLEGFQKSQEVAERRRFALSIMATGLSSILIGGVTLLIVLKVIHGSLSIATFIFLWSSLQSLQGAMSSTLRAIADHNEVAQYAAENYEVIDAKPDVRSGTLMCAERIPTIAFENVTFSYPWDSHDRVILKDVSFTIRPGERIGLVGINGAGKTTLIKLLCGIYQPTEGRILIDGVDLEELDIRSWQGQIAALFQNYSNHQTIIRDAISIGDTSVPYDESRLERASKASGVDVFASDLPGDLDTMIGRDFEGGIELSGGQSQRIALARVFYRQGKLIILDEPTASLDAFIEAQIFEELEKRPRDATTILITHRLSSVKNTDRILVLENGRLAEQGSHAELMGINGIYALMFQKQAKGFMTQPIDNKSED